MHIQSNHRQSNLPRFKIKIGKTQLLQNLGSGPKQGYQWPHKKDLCPPKFFFKKVELIFFYKLTAKLTFDT